MSTDKISEKDLKRFFKEERNWERDISPLVMKRILDKKPMVFIPAKMPAAILWGIVVLLMGALSTALYHLESNSIFLNETLPSVGWSLPSPSWSIDPILAIASLAVMLGVWAMVLFEKKLLRN